MDCNSLPGLKRTALPGGILTSAPVRVTADAGFARTDVEDAEAAEFDSVALGKSLLHALKDNFNGPLGLGFSDASACDDFVDDVQLDHAAAPIVQKYVRTGCVLRHCKIRL